MASNNVIDFARAFGYSSTAAAIVFAVLYFPLLAYFIFQSFARPTYVHIVMVVFCSSESRILSILFPVIFIAYTHLLYSVRIAAFVLRAVLVSIESEGQKLGLLIADQILFGVGFFGLLYSAYTLVLDM